MDNLKMTELIKFKIDNAEDRADIVRILAEAGYAVRVIREEMLIGYRYYVCVYE